jgi:hypothetical protein
MGCTNDTISPRFLSHTDELAGTWSDFRLLMGRLFLDAGAEIHSSSDELTALNPPMEKSND